MFDSKLLSTNISLWELEASKFHFHPKVSIFTEYLENPDSTSALKVSINSNEFIDYSYSSMISSELNKLKDSIAEKNDDSHGSSKQKRKRGSKPEESESDAVRSQHLKLAALSHRAPTALYGAGSMIQACFE
jgi:hypothetical protein